MIASTPPMGWNSWNTFGPNIDENLILETADALVETGLRDAGYRYLVVDDVWMAPERKNGLLVPDPERFSMGIGPLVQEVHDRGLLFGIYSSAGTHTCEDLPASYGFEQVDADTFAEWEVDFLKYDFCHTAAGADPVALYRRMGQALRATGRDILYSICEWGANQPWEWASSVGAHMWRTTEDIVDSWESVSRLGFELQTDLHPYAGPGHWNDPDMLVVGMHGKGHVGRTGLTDAEYRSHFALWCLLASPLMIGCDVRSMDDATRHLLLDESLIAINQDPLGRQGYRASSHGHTHGETWAKALADGSWAVGIFNRTERPGEFLTVGWELFGLKVDTAATVHNLSTGRIDHGVVASFGTRVDSHDVHVLRITPERT
ncbi:MAG: glycoside hydrolase family 27 protein [Acidimicrobiia bacterium]|nr:glycoside hydrolase family 27 protein [Acidimicrobiia bacterium]